MTKTREKTKRLSNIAECGFLVATDDALFFVCTENGEVLYFVKDKNRATVLRRLNFWNTHEKEFREFVREECRKKKTAIQRSKGSNFKKFVIRPKTKEQK